MSVKAPAPILISRTPASKHDVALSKLHRLRNDSVAVGDVIGIGGETRSSSDTVAPSAPSAEFGADELLAAEVPHKVPVPVMVLVQPAGSAGAVTPSKLSVAPQVPGAEQMSPAVQALPSLHEF